jgi:hypothetical protein
MKNPQANAARGSSVGLRDRRGGLQRSALFGAEIPVLDRGFIGLASVPACLFERRALLIDGAGPP